MYILYAKLMSGHVGSADCSKHHHNILGCNLLISSMDMYNKCCLKYDRPAMICGHKLHLVTCTEVYSSIAIKYLHSVTSILVKANSVV